LPAGDDGATVEVDGPVEPPQPISELAAAHSRSSMAIVRKTNVTLRRRIASPSAIKLGNPSAAQAVARELPKGEGGDVRLATTPVLIVMVEVAELAPPLKAIEDGANVQLAFCGRPVQVSCNVPEYPCTVANVNTSETVPDAGTVSDELAGDTASTAMEADADCAKFASPLYCAVRFTSPVGNAVAV